MLDHGSRLDDPTHGDPWLRLCYFSWLLQRQDHDFCPFSLLATVLAALEPASRRNTGKKEPRARGLSSARGWEVLRDAVRSRIPADRQTPTISAGCDVPHAWAHHGPAATAAGEPGVGQDPLHRLSPESRHTRPLARAGSQSRGLMPQCQPLSGIHRGWQHRNAAVHEVDARQPELGLADLGHRRQVVRTVPDAAGETVATLAGHAVDELLTKAILLHLDVETGQLGQKPVRLGALLQSLCEAPRDHRVVGQQLAAHRVHDVVGIPLHDTHRRLHLREERALLGVHQRFQPAPGFAAPGSDPIDVQTKTTQSLGAQIHRILAQETEVALQHGVEVVTQPGMRLELEGVRRLMQRQPHAELVAWQPEGVLGCLDIWLNIVEAAGAQRLAAEEREVVLSEYLAREVAEEKPDLGAEHFLVERAEHLPRDRAVRRISQKAEPF